MILRSMKALFILMMSIGLVACSGGAGTTGSATQNEASKQAPKEQKPATRVVKHKMGETEIPAEPKRIFVTLQRIADPMLALGIKPHAITVYGDAKYLGDKLNGVKLIPAYPADPEVVMAENPDLIVADPWVKPEVYEKYSKIAPTIVVDGNDWRTFFPHVAEMFNKKPEYEKWMKEYNDKTAKAKEKLAKQLGDKTVIVLRVQNKYIAPWAKQGAASQVLFTDLGLKVHEKVGDKWEQISLEALPQFDADYMFLEIRSTANGEANMQYFNENLKDSAIWKGMKAVKSGNVFPITTDLWIEGDGPIGRSAMIDEVLSRLNIK